MYLALPVMRAERCGLRPLSATVLWVVLQVARLQGALSLLTPAHFSVLYESYS